MRLPLRHGRFLLSGAMALAVCCIFCAVGCRGGGAALWDTGQVKRQGPMDPETGGRIGEWEFYNRDGTVRARGSYENGQMQGKWTWFYSTGEREYECEFLRGMRHGACKRFEIDGVMRHFGRYVSDKKSGPWKFYSKAGTLVIDIHYLEDTPHGECKIYYGPGIVKDGKPVLKAVCNFDHGALDGKHRTFTSEGKPSSEATFAQGKMVDAKCWDIMGIKGSNDEAEKLVKQAVAADGEALDKIDEITNTDYKAELKGQ